jgi:PAS domain S-box-containing protein
MNPTAQTRFRRIGELAGVTAFYFLAAELGLLLAPPGGNSIWPPAGIALAAIMVLGWRGVPAVFLGACLVGVVTSESAFAVLVVATGQTLEGIVGAGLVRRFARGCSFHERPQDILKFAVLAGMASTLLCPPFGLERLALRDLAVWSADGSRLLVWWLGEIMSVLVVVPLIVLWHQNPRVRWNRFQILEITGLMLLLVVVSGVIFGSLPPASAQRYLLPYLCLPFPVWAAFRFGPRETATATCLQGAVALWGTLQGYGLFARNAPDAALLAFQVFMMFNAVMSLIVAAVVAQRRAAQGALQRAHDDLELQVQRRTQSLQDEIEERKRAEHALRESEAQRLRAEAFSLVMVAQVGLDGRWLKVPPTFCALLGYPESELLQLRCQDVTHPQDVESDRRQLQRLLCGEVQSYELEKRYVRKDGGDVWISLNRSMVTDEQTRPLFFLTYIRDITERKNAETALRRSEARLNCSQEIAHLGSWELDLMKNELTWSDEVYRIMGLKQQEFGATFEAFLEQVHPDDRTAVEAAYASSVREGRESYEIEHRVIRKHTGEVRTVLEKCEHFRDATGKIIRSVGMMHDITERKQAEAVLRESEERLAGIIGSAMDAIISVNEHQQVVLFNAAAERMFGCAASDALGQPVSRFIPQRFRQAHEQHLRQFGETGETARAIGALGEVSGLRVTGEEFPVEASISRMMAGGHKLYTVVLRDITERKRNEEALRRVHEELEQRVQERTAALTEANRALQAEIAQRQQAEAARSQVFSRLVNAQETERRRMARELHDELGQQLTGLKLAVQLVQEQGPCSPLGQQKLAELKETVDQLMEDVHNLAWELRPATLDDFGVVLTLERYVQDWSKRSAIAADFQSLGLPAQALAPELQTTLYRVAQEALTNVLRHARARHVSVLLKRTRDRVSLIVEDDGEGFDAEHAFDARFTDKRLGLLGMRERVMLAGGTLEVESGHGRGTTIYARFPVPQNSAAGPAMGACSRGESDEMNPLRTTARS